MIYKAFQELQLSALGMGCMRFPTLEDGNIDIPAVKEMVAYAMEKGINYYDTAWGYHNGQSELVIGEVLEAYPRESFYLASKFPGYDANNMAKVEEIFEKQLEKCRVEYFDFYLFHNVTESNIDGYLNPAFGIYDYLMEQKRQGRIRHLGFSAHGNMDTIRRFLAAYGKDIEFCQLQINWLDWDFQDAKAKVELMREHHIPVWVMEPVRGGSLVELAPEYTAKLRALRPEAKTVEWAFRFIQAQPDMVVTLSGMSNFTQLKENIATYESEQPLDPQEVETLFAIAREMTAKKSLACTSCRYCTEYCPQKINIPAIIKLYNEHIFSGGGFIAPMGLSAIPEGQRPADCIACKACEAVCPQNIKISDMMADFTEKVRK